MKLGPGSFPTAPEMVAKIAVETSRVDGKGPDSTAWVR